MCEFVSKKCLKEPKAQFLKIINKVQKQIKDKYKITFSYRPIGSGKKNLVVKKCTTNEFDLDYEITLQKILEEIDLNDAKKIKYLFIEVLNEFLPKEFNRSEDSTQAITIKNPSFKFGYDIIITYVLGDARYILRNDKNSNNANNNDYKWAQMCDYRSNYKLIKGPEMNNHLRKLYLKKRHNSINGKSKNQKKSYQILNEAINETLKVFNVQINV